MQNSKQIYYNVIQCNVFKMVACFGFELGLTRYLIWTTYILGGLILWYVLSFGLPSFRCLYLFLFFSFILFMSCNYSCISIFNLSFIPFQFSLSLFFFFFSLLPCSLLVNIIWSLLFTLHSSRYYRKKEKELSIIHIEEQREENATQNHPNLLHHSIILNHWTYNCR